jgi:molybdopterin-binding protein
MKVSARNMFKGKVKKIDIGAVNAEVIIELPSGLEIVSIITKNSVQRLGLKAGSQASVIIKASNVIIAVD